MSSENKRIATDFLHLAAAGKIDEAYEKYVDMSGKHHNAYFAAGFASLKQAMKDSDSESPNKELIVNLTVAEDDLVAVHSRLIRSAEGPEISVVHILRIANGKIVEMWDCGMELPIDGPNTDGAF